MKWKRRGLALASVALVAVIGCALTEGEKTDIVAKSAALAGEAAYQKTLEAVTRKLDDQTAKQLDALKAAGATAEQLAEMKKKLDEQSKAMAAEIAEAARNAAEAATGAIADKAIPTSEDAKKTKTGNAIAEIVGVVLLLAQGALRKGLI